MKSRLKGKISFNLNNDLSLTKLLKKKLAAPSNNPQRNNPKLNKSRKPIHNTSFSS